MGPSPRQGKRAVGPPSRNATHPRQRDVANHAEREVEPNHTVRTDLNREGGLGFAKRKSARDVLRVTLGVVLIPFIFLALPYLFLSILFLIPAVIDSLEA